MKINKIVCVTVCIGLIVSLMSGCKKTVDMSDLQSPDNMTSFIASKVNAPEHLSYVVSESGSETGNYYKVEADVLCPDASSVNLYREELVEIDAETCFDIAKNFFDDGKYSVVKPYDCYTTGELKDELSRVEGYINNRDGISSELFRVRSRLNRLLEKTIDADRAEFNEDGMTSYEELADDELYYSDESTWGEDVMLTGEKLILKGFVDGEEYYLYARKYDETDENSRVNGLKDGIKIRRAEQHGLIADPMDLQNFDGGMAVYEYNGVIYYENYGMAERKTHSVDISAKAIYGQYDDISLEEACNMANRYANRLGYGIMENAFVEYSIESRYKADSDEKEPHFEEEEYISGYTVYMKKNVDGIREIYSPNITYVGEDEKSVAFDDTVTVSVNAYGLEAIDIASIYQTVDVISSDVNLMNFNEIDQVAQNDMVKTIEEMSVEFATGNYKISISSVEFGYIHMAYEEGYVYMPVWIYYETVEEGKEPLTTYRWPAIILNAMDGSVVNYHNGGVG